MTSLVPSIALFKIHPLDQLIREKRIKYTQEVSGVVREYPGLYRNIRGYEGICCDRGVGIGIWCTGMREFRISLNYVNNCHSLPPDTPVLTADIPSLILVTYLQLHVKQSKIRFFNGVFTLCRHWIHYDDATNISTTSVVMSHTPASNSLFSEHT